MCGRSRRYGPEARVPENETALKNYKIMLSEKMQEALNAQINAEMWSAYL